MASGAVDLLGNKGCSRCVAASLAARNVMYAVDADGDGRGIEVGLQHEALSVNSGRVSPLEERSPPGVGLIGPLTRFADVHRPNRVPYVDLVDVDQPGLFH